MTSPDGDAPRSAREPRATSTPPASSGSSTSGPPNSPGAPASAPGAGEVTANTIVRASAARVFAAFIAWERQGEWIPFTTVRVVTGDGGEGSTVEAVTSIGPARLVDVMRVERVDPPYQVKVVHTGRVLRGPGVIRITPMGPDRTQVVWHEWLQLPAGALGRAAWPLLWPGSKAGLTQALKRFARLVEARRLP